MNVLISGATGLIGSALVPELEAKGHTVTRLSRSKAGAGTIRWDPSAGTIDGDLEGTEAVVHLAGESIAQGRWNPEKKTAHPRQQGAGDSSAGRDVSPPSPSRRRSWSRPRPSATTGTVATRSSPRRAPRARTSWPGCAGSGRPRPSRRGGPASGSFTRGSGSCSARRAAPSGRRLPIFKLGGGGKIGSGRQWWSWVALDDVVGSIVHALTDEDVEGPVNVGSPNPMTNAEYTKVLGRVLGRPTVLPLPAPAARIMLGEVADALLLASQRMEPAKLKATGYDFRYPQLEGALRHLLGR